MNTIPIQLRIWVHHEKFIDTYLIPQGLQTCAGVGQAGTGNFFVVYLHNTSVIFTGFGTQMSAANPLFAYLLCLDTNILILFGGKRHPEERGASGSSILYIG